MTKLIWNHGWPHQICWLSKGTDMKDKKKTNHLFDCLYKQSFPSNTNEMKCQRDCKNHFKYCSIQIVSFAVLDWSQPASRVFLSLLQFWCISERLNELSKIFVEHPLLIALVKRDQLWHGFINRRMLALKKSVWQKKTRSTSPEIQAVATSEA